MLKKSFFQTPLNLATFLYDSDEIKHFEVIKHSNNELIEFRNSINTKEIPENQNPKK